jgi:hypothetical protein
VAAGALAAAAAVGVVTGVVYLLRAHVPALSLGVLYVLAVSAVAVFFGRALAVSVSLASVDLRSPLTAIRAALEGLASPELTLDDTRRERLFSTALSETLGLDRLVRNLLDLSRLQAGAARAAPDLRTIEGLLDQALVHTARDPRVEVCIPAGMPLVYADAIQIDDETGEADWIGLVAGTFRRRHLLVPAAGVEVDGASLKVPWPKHRIEEAPTYGDSDHRGVLGLSDYRTAISEEKERLACAHYGLEDVAGGTRA